MVGHRQYGHSIGYAAAKRGRLSKDIGTTDRMPSSPAFLFRRAGSRVRTGIPAIRRNSMAARIPSAETVSITGDRRRHGWRIHRGESSPPWLRTGPTVHRPERRNQMLTQILLQILRGTPVWVYPLFLGLVVMGYLQSKPREVAPAMVAILPVAIGVFSLSKVLAIFGLEPLGLAAWAAGTAAALLLNRALKQPAGARWSDANGTFHVPGSWVPLVLMMAVFFVRYALAVSLVMRPELAHSTGFTAAASFGSGLLSGVFLARALWVWSQRSAGPAFNRIFNRA
jgi:hypothetical protein